MAAVRGRPLSQQLFPCSQFDCVPDRSADRGSSACSLICIRLMRKFLQEVPRGFEFTDVDIVNLMKNTVTEYDKQHPVTGLTIDGLRNDVGSEFNITELMPVRTREELSDHMKTCTTPFAVLFTAPKLQDSSNTGTGNSFAMMVASKGTWIFDSHKHDSRLGGGAGAGAVLATFRTSHIVVEALHWMYERLLPSMACKSDYCEVMIMQKSLKRNSRAKSQSARPTKTLTLSGRRILEMEAPNHAPLGEAPVQTGSSSRILEQEAPSQEPLEEATVQTGSSSRIFEQEAPSKTPLEEETVLTGHSVAESGDALSRTAAEDPDASAVAAAPVQESKISKRDLKEAYQDSIRSIGINWSDKTWDGRPLKVKHVVDWCKIHIAAVNIPFKTAIFKEILTKEAERGEKAALAEQKKATQSMISRGIMLSAPKLDENSKRMLQLPRWREAGTELKGLLLQISEALAQQPAERLVSDEWQPLELLVNHADNLICATSTRPPNKEKYTGGLIPAATFAKLLQEMNRNLPMDCVPVVHQLCELFFVTHSRSCEIMATHAKRKTIMLQDILVLSLCTKYRFHSCAREDFVKGASSQELAKTDLPSTTLSSLSYSLALKFFPISRMKLALVNRCSPLKADVGKELSAIFMKILLMALDEMESNAKKAGRDVLSPVDIVKFLSKEALQFAGYQTLAVSSADQQ